MKSITSILSVLIATVVVSCSGGAKKESTTKALPLQVVGYKVGLESFNNDLITTAELLPSEQVALKAPMSGQVLDIYFKEGKKVTKGAPIIRLDDRSWKAQLAGVEAELTTARNDYTRKKALLEVEGSTQEEVDQVFSTIATLESQLKQLQVNIDLANVVAPFSGELGMRNFSKGAFLNQGDVITTLTELNHLKVDFTLAQEYIKDIEIGKVVKVLVAGDTLEARVYAINPMIDAISRTMHVRALLEQKSNKTILPGTFAEVLVNINFIQHALLIPTQAIVPEIDKQTVYLFKDGKAVKMVVKMGNRTADKVHILEGIEDGDIVITTGLLEIKDGMNVELSKQNP